MKFLLMKTKNTTKVLALLVGMATFYIQPSTLHAQGTAFTYQGRLNDGASPANGSYDLTFALFDTNSGGSALAEPLTNAATGVTNGLFTVTLDFGAGVFNGTSYWLEIGVETNGGGSFNTLSPRQQLTPAPYAVYAGSANALGGTLSATQLTSIGNDNGGENFFVGTSGNATTSGYNNTAIGVYALSANTNGSDNAASGYLALYQNRSGSKNTAAGSEVLFKNTSGSYNVANGVEALWNNTSGSRNTANGSFTLFANVSGSDNIALGNGAGGNIIGSENIDIGNEGSPDDNNIIRIGTPGTHTNAYIAGVIFGDGSGLTNLQNLNAAQLTSIGNDNGGENFFVGTSGNATTSGYNNTANGYKALFNIAGGNENTANGSFALVNNLGGFDNTANGFNALYHNFSGSYNTANGANALLGNGNGSYNTADGYYALNQNSAGYSNIAVGSFAGANILGNQNIDIGNPGFSTDNNIIRIGTPTTHTNAYIAGVIIGDGSGLTNLRNLNAAQLTSIGNTNSGFDNFFAGPAGNATTSGFDNTAYGSGALAANTSGDQNTANGAFALNHNTSGSYNAAHGSFALYNNTTGHDNTAQGDESLYNNTSGAFNTAVGSEALHNNTSGSSNIGLGSLAGLNILTGSGNIDIGNQGFATDTNIIRIGDGQTETFIAGNVGIGVGTTSPGKLLQLGNSTNQTDGMIRLSCGNGPFARAWDIGVPYGTNSSGSPYYGFVINDVSGGTNRFAIDFNTGNVGIGTTKPDALLSVNGSADKPGGGSWGTFSDSRLKDVGENFTHGLESLGQLQPVHYHYKSDNPLNLPSNPDYVGVVAQQVQQAIPEAVQKNKAGYLVVNNDPIIWTMLNAIKQLKAENERLEQKETEITELKSRLEKLERLINEKQNGGVR
jgi:hypothetical protein